jgi:hypothetical protein
MSADAMPHAEVGATAATFAGASEASSTEASPPASAVALCTLRQQSTPPLPTQFSSAHRLHKDALHCVLAYLSLKELHAAMRSCRAWYAAVRSLPLQNVSLRVSSARQLHQLIVSSSTPLARHIVTCHVWGEYTADYLAQFLARMPRLRSLSHQFCYSTELQPQLYSSHLRELEVHFGYDSDSDAGNSADEEEDEEEDESLRVELAAQMASLSSASGLRRLTLTVPGRGYAGQSVSLQPLECMKELEELTLLNSHALRLEDLALLRRLPSLRKLTLGDWSERQLMDLLEDCPDCPLLRLLHDFEGFDHKDCDLDRAELIVRMPMLQRLEPRYITPEALQRVAHGLPNLRTLQLSLDPRRDATHVSDWSMVRESLAACHQLTALTLAKPPVEELAAVLLALPPSLRKLDIFYCAGFLQSDAFFQSVTEGGLRQLQQLHVRLEFYEEDDSNPALIAAWLTRQRACAPWINAWLI